MTSQTIKISVIIGLLECLKNLFIDIDSQIEMLEESKDLNYVKEQFQDFSIKDEAYLIKTQSLSSLQSLNSFQDTLIDNFTISNDELYLISNTTIEIIKNPVKIRQSQVDFMLKQIKDFKIKSKKTSFEEIDQYLSQISKLYGIILSTLDLVNEVII